LIDYDPAVNNGNWQWVASTGCDAQPYFRIFNPWNQQKKFDPDCLYIKKWVPELSDFPSKAIHAWDEEKYHGESKKYPAPMTNHQKAAKKALDAYTISKK
jgi:deoxyribodipyrimidine photo-lyase